MLQGIGHLQGVMKETSSEPKDKKKKKKNKFMEALSKFSKKNSNQRNMPLQN